MQKVVDGLLVNYEVVGKGQPMLVLPGWKSGIADWLPFSNEFKSKYKIILVDLPGFGGTAKPSGDWGIYEYADFTARFLRAVEIKKAAVLGHSFGGRVAVLLGSRFQGLVTRLVLVDAAGMEIKSLKSRLVRLVKPIVFWLPQEWKNKLGSRDYRGAGDMRRTLVKIVNQPLRHELANITIPTLIIWGEKDRELSLKEAEMLHLGIRGSTLRIVWGANHWPHQEKFEDFMRILAEEGV